jgi:hypothetical protein
VIHAYLASGRPHPLVAAGISAGALTAAAMQRSYRELAHTRHHDPAVREAARWKWFRKYLGDLSNQPLDFLWRAIPDPVDFSADRKPVTDTACGVLEAEEAEARRHYYILVKLGVWLAGLPVRVQSIAQLLVHYVRWKERYGGWLWNLLALIGAGTKIAAGLFWHTLWAPTLVRRKPLFGWWVWLSAVVTAAWLLTLGAAAGARVFGDPGAWIHVVLRASAVGAGVLVLGAVTFFCWEAAKKGLFLAFSRHVFGQLDLAKSLLTPYQLQRRLLTLFREGAQDPEKADDVKVGKDPLHLLLVSANLKDGEQLPAVEVLNAMQVSGRREPLQPDTDPTPAQIDEVLQALRRRHDRRDIFIAAALDADPGPLREKLDTMMKVKNRAGSLQKNGKIESFLKSSRKIHAQVGMILLTERIALRKWLKGLRTTEERVWNLKLLDGIVDAAILKIVPADDEHINPTFAFCCATGMKADKVRTSIADGCYQTLVQIRKHAGEPDYTALPATLEDRDSAKAGESDCAWFRRNGQPLPCPFAQNADDQVGAVRKVCAGDKKHKPVSQPIGLRLLTALQALFK